MSENDAKKNKHRFKDIEKTSRESNEQQVLTVAAFCFAIVSWMAIAEKFAGIIIMNFSLQI